MGSPIHPQHCHAHSVQSPVLACEKYTVLEIVKKTSTYFEFIYGILIPLLVFTPVFISGGLIIDMVTEEYERRTMELLAAAPVSFSQILQGKILVAVLIVPAQALLWLALVEVNRIAVHNIPGILLVITVMAMDIVLLGAIIGARYRDRISLRIRPSTWLRGCRLERQGAWMRLRAARCMRLRLRRCLLMREGCGDDG